MKHWAIVYMFGVLFCWGYLIMVIDPTKNMASGEKVVVPIALSVLWPAVAGAYFAKYMEKER